MVEKLKVAGRTFGSGALQGLGFALGAAIVTEVLGLIKGQVELTRVGDTVPEFDPDR